MKIKSVELPKSLEKSLKYNPRLDTRLMTANEFKDYVKYLATNRINKCFNEPDKFITAEERQKTFNFKKMVKYLAENRINRTFFS